MSLWDRIGAPLAHRRRMVATGDRVAITAAPIDTLYFPVDAVFVLARHDANDTLPLASGMVGREGVAGWAQLLGAERWPHTAFAVIGGDVVEVATDALATAMATDPELRALILRYVNNYTMQLAQNTIANLGHSLERRLARWLTMFHDRAPGDEMRLTHETLAMLLNVRRASVTDSLHILEGERLVRCTRGRVTVRDRPGLQARAGYSYGYAERDYNAAIGPFGKASAGEQA